MKSGEQKKRKTGDGSVSCERLENGCGRRWDSIGGLWYVIGVYHFVGGVAAIPSPGEKVDQNMQRAYFETDVEFGRYGRMR